MLHLDLILEAVSHQSDAEIDQWAYLLGFFHILVRPSSNLGQYFSDMTCILHLLCSLFTIYLFIIFMTLIFVLHVTFL